MYSILIIILTSLLNAWKIDTTASQISYKGEHTFHAWEGISKKIDFEMSCAQNICELFISVPLNSFDSGNDSRDSNMLYYTESLLYPNVSFKSKKFKFNSINDTSIDMNGIIDFHGIQKEIPVKVSLLRESNSFIGKCDFDIDITSFNVERPSLLMIKISETIKIKANLKMINLD